MKIAIVLPALLLGTTLLAGSALAQNNNNNPPPSPPPPHMNWHHDANPANGAPAPLGAQNGHANFAAHNGAPNQAHWNHALNFHDRNVAHFGAQDRAIWTQGQWHHARHNGRNGWWWTAGGAWFFYDQPTYPYPGYVSEDFTLDDEADNAGPAPQYAGPTPGMDPYSWYYCNNPAGYYPYVQSCRGPWQPVQPNVPGYGNQAQQNGPGAYDNNDDDRGAPPPGWQQGRDDYRGQANGPPQGYDNGDNNDDNDQGPPPGYNGDDRGPPPGYNGDDRGPPPGYDDQQGPPPGYGDQGPPPRN